MFQERGVPDLLWSDVAEKRMHEGHTVEELMRLRAQIDQELNQRLSQTLCLMFADVVGSTAFYQKHGDVEGRLFVQRHHDILTPLILQWQGRVIKTIGDAIMAAFDKPEDAFDCAIAIQHTLYKTRLQGPEEMALQTKVSLHYGSALVETDDVYGDLVNMSARLSGMVAPDQILISQTVYESVKDRKDPPILPLPTRSWKEGERGISVYEVLWQPPSETDHTPPLFRTFEGRYHACFYCGLPEHEVTQCPSKQITGHARCLQQLGYLPLAEILGLFQQEDLNAVVVEQARGNKAFEAFYEISLPYQLRFLTKVWLATSEDWSSLERQQAATVHPLAGSRLWMGLDCLRVGRYDQAKTFLRSTIDSNPGDYKPYVVFGLAAMENGDPHGAIRHWRKGLGLTKSTLQTAYLHLLLHRLYASNGKTQLAHQELQKALSSDPYLYEAKYRQLALQVGGERGFELLPLLRKLIEDDRIVYLKVLLDPAFAPLRQHLHQLLLTLCQEMRTEALQRIRAVAEQVQSLRDWYPRPDGELIAVEEALERLRQHMKSQSYFGYHDAVHDSDILLLKLQKLSTQRRTSLQREYTATLAVLHKQIASVTLSHTLARNVKLSERLAMLSRELKRLQSLTNFSTAKQFWHAWEAMQKLTTAVQELTSAHTQRAGLSPQQRRLVSLALFGVGGSILLDTALFALFGYLTYASKIRLSHGRLLLFLAFGAVGGMALGGAMGLLLQWYRRRRQT
jgi:class 3 adenylate cyclase/tetratricopeptide (TPR) repeat protein